jgi:copper chaperone NosL
MSNTQKAIISTAATVVAAGLLVLSLKLPLWQMRMESPQYREEEALRVIIYPNAMAGDLREIDILNQYIGVHRPTDLPQFHWLPFALIAGGTLGVVASVLPQAIRKLALMGAASTLVITLAVAAGQAQKQMHDIGHMRDVKTKMARTKDFTPPLLGTAKLAQFTITSRFGTGAYLIGAAIALQFSAACASSRRWTVSQPCPRTEGSAINPTGNPSEVAI